MRVLILSCHPVETSFHAALQLTARNTLERSGHEVDDCDLYAERFDPVMSREERLNYLDTALNRRAVQGYVDRLLAAEALVLCFPIWSFGPPAILKGFFDRVFLPGVSFHLHPDGRVSPGLTRIRRVAAIVTYGRPRWQAWLIGDPPRRLMTRYLRFSVGLLTPATFLAHYRMNVSTEASRARFLRQVERAMERF